MRTHGEITINGKPYRKGVNLPWKMVYPFFLFHMLIFGISGFFLAYGSDADISFVFMHGGLAILVYLIFYFTIFGVDEVRWMFVNAGLGLFGIYAQIDWILSLFGRHAEDFVWYVHIVPFLYYVLYTFLIRQAIIDISGSRENVSRRQFVDRLYVIASLVTYSIIYLSPI